MAHVAGDTALASAAEGSSGRRMAASYALTANEGEEPIGASRRTSNAWRVVDDDEYAAVAGAWQTMLMTRPMESSALRL